MEKEIDFSMASAWIEEGGGQASDVLELHHILTGVIQPSHVLT